MNIPNNKKQTPLHFAVILGNKSMIEMLLEYGADPNLVDDQGLSPKQLALKVKLKKLFNLKFLKKTIPARN